MAITDLTGTKWLLEQGWTAASGFGQFSIEVDIEYELLSDITATILFGGGTN